MQDDAQAHQLVAVLSVELAALHHAGDANEQYRQDAEQDKRIGQISAGERYRVQLAKMLKSGADLLLLYEPADDLDTLSAGSAG